MRRLKEVTNLGHSKAECRQAFCVIQIALHSDWTIQSPPALILGMQSFSYSCNFYFPFLDSIGTKSCISRQCSLLSCFEEWDVITASVRLRLSEGQWPEAGHGQTLQTGTCIGGAFLQGYGRCQLIRAPMMGNRQRTLYWWDIDESPLDWSHLWPAPGPDDHWGKVSAAFLTEYSSPVSLQ